MYSCIGQLGHTALVPPQWLFAYLWEWTGAGWDLKNQHGPYVAQSPGWNPFPEAAQGPALPVLRTQTFGWDMLRNTWSIVNDQCTSIPNPLPGLPPINPCQFLQAFQP